MAAALTYRTIFGLIPMIVMALIVFKAFGGFDDSQQGLTKLVYTVLEIDIDTEAPSDADASSADVEIDGTAGASNPARSWLGRQIDFMNGATPDATDQAAAEEARANAEMKRKIDEVIGGLARNATSIRIGSIGVVGMLVLIWAAVGLIVTVEKTFNIIFRAPQGRPWHVRIPIYWAIITLGPVLIWASFYLSTRLADAVEGVYALDWLLGLLNQFTALIVTWLLFVLIFKLMPNARVAIKPALAGALVSALAWETMKVALRWYIESAVLSPTQAQLYGSLALIPVFLFWVYVSWLVVLAGLQVTHILQTLPAHRRGRFESSRQEPVARDPRLVIPVMSVIAQRFETGKTCGVETIADEIGASIASVSQIVDGLVTRGLLHRLPNDDGPADLALAMPPGRIRIADLITTVPDHADLKNIPGRDLLKQLADAQDKALADLTLESRRPVGDG
ncbi:MAG: YihY/virulence factor BrkB family protein, partial [Phycisphaeraceae bacterium]